MKTFIKTKEVRESLEQTDDSFWSYEPEYSISGKEIGDAYIKKITNRLNYIINNLLHKSLIWQETTDMFPKEPNIDYSCIWVLSVNIEKQTINFEVMDATYQKAVMLPFGIASQYE